MKCPGKTPQIIFLSNATKRLALRALLKRVQQNKYYRNHTASIKPLISIIVIEFCKLGKVVHFQSPTLKRSKQAVIHTSESFLLLFSHGGELGVTLSGVDNTQLRWRGKDAVGLRERERRRKQQQAPAAHTNREKQQFQAGRLSFLPSDPAHTRAGACVTHTSLPWLWTDKTRTEEKCSRQRSTWE